MSVQSPREYYSVPDNAQAISRYWPDVPILDVVNDLDQHAGDGVTVPYLDSLGTPEQGYSKRKFAARMVIGFMDPRTVIHAYGEETLAWAAMNVKQSTPAEAINRAIDTETSFDLTTLQKTATWFWQRSGPAVDGVVQLRQYRLHRSLLEDSFDTIDLPELLQTSAVAGTKIDDKRAADYSLQGVTARKNYETGLVTHDWNTEDPLTYYDVWVDAPAGFVLNYKGKPNAIAGVSAVSSDEMRIHQLQGVRPYILPTPSTHNLKDLPRKSARGLAPLDWKSLLVGISERIAQDKGFSSLSIQHSSANDWLKHTYPDGSPHMTIEAAVNTYDDTARRLGFEPGDDGHWYKDIS